MGVPHLNSFVTNKISNCLFDVDIMQEINNWYSEHTEKPTIIIDFLAFGFGLRRDPYDGRIEHCLKEAEQFFNILKQKCVNLVFFDKKGLDVNRIKKIIRRQNQKSKDIFNFLNDLYENPSAEALVTKCNFKLHGSISAGLRAIARTFGEFHTSYHANNKELSYYAVKVNALAIISDDTDFLIYKGKWNYWSSKHLDLNKLTTKNYDKTNLQCYLSLTESEMPLFATLAGNEFIPLNLLDGFHRYLGNPWYKFKNISHYIIREFRNLNTIDPAFIARKVFRKINESPAYYTELVTRSLNWYNLDLLLVDELNENDLLCRFKKLNNNYFMFLLDVPMPCTLSYFNVKITEFEKYPSLVLDLIRRQMGVILQHKNDKTLTRHILIYQEGQFVYKTIHPEYPTILVPSLDDLCNVDKNDELKMIKLQLLAWILSNQLDVNAIKFLDRKYFGVCLTLFYMVENNFVSVQEADIFLHVIETGYENSSILNDLPRINCINSRAFQLVFLYNKLYKYITYSVANCGLFEFKENSHMDGPYFHDVYNKMLNSDPNGNEKLNIHLGHLRLFDYCN